MERQENSGLVDAACQKLGRFEDGESRRQGGSPGLGDRKLLDARGILDLCSEQKERQKG